MVRVELAVTIVEHEGYSSSMLHRTIKNGVLKTVQYDNILLSHTYL